MENYTFQRIKWDTINKMKIIKFHKQEKLFMDWHPKQDIKKQNL